MDHYTTKIQIKPYSTVFNDIYTKMNYSALSQGSVLEPESIYLNLTKREVSSPVIPLFDVSTI